MRYRFSTPPRSLSWGGLSLVLLLLGPGLASADAPTHTLRLDAAAALMVGEQSDRFDLGGGFGLGYELRPVDHLGVEGRYSGFFFPEANGDGFGGYHAAGLALRAHPLPHLSIGDLWIAGGGDVVFTGDLTRFGLEAGAGFEFRLGECFRLGPYARYAHVFQPSSDALGGADAGFLQLGISLAYSPKRRAKDAPAEDAAEDEAVEETIEAPAPMAVAEAEPEPELEELTADDADEAEAVAVRELQEVGARILFPHGSDEPIVDSMAALVRVGQLLEAHPQWEKITIEGHASETGSPEANYRLSQRRAERVRELLILGGVDPSRIEVVARGKDEVEAPGDHARNRRVVFKVHVLRRVPR